MKQHIDTTDLEKLSKSGKESLREWWKPQEGDFYTDKYKYIYLCNEKSGDTIYSTGWNGAGGYEHSKKLDCLLLLSIGQMIEFLDEKKIDFTIYPNADYWVIDASYLFTTGFCQEKELCDALWKACIAILNKD